MKKVVVYFSDIMGTILGNKTNTEEDYHQFNNLLSTIKEKEQADEIIFALISTDNQDIVANMHSVIAPFIGQTVTFGRQYFGDGYYTESEVVRRKYLGKPWDIIEYIGQLSQSSKVVSVYYADDILMYHTMSSFMAKKNNWEHTLHSIIPTSHAGLSETNQLLDDDIKKTFGPQR